MNSQQESGSPPSVPSRFPQVKVCGLKTAEEAVACACLGVHAIGLVFYPPSPRSVTDAAAREVCRNLPDSVARVGVFVQEGFDSILRRVEVCGIDTVQLHGREDPELVLRLSHQGVRVIKTLFADGSPGIAAVSSYSASAAFLIECRGGPLPGGNAKSWDWASAAFLGERYPTILAGGLTPDNVTRAAAQAMPDALDVSSGVEISPGKKDIPKVRKFMEAVIRTPSSRTLRRIFP